MHLHYSCPIFYWCLWYTLSWWKKDFSAYLMKMILLRKIMLVHYGINFGCTCVIFFFFSNWHSLHRLILPNLKLYTSSIHHHANSWTCVVLDQVKQVDGVKHTVKQIQEFIILNMLDVILCQLTWLRPGNTCLYFY